MGNVSYQIALPPDCAVEFFAIFSRFEFALLAAEYVGGDPMGTVCADWDRFSADIHKSFLIDVRNDQECRVFFEMPPRKLILLKNKTCRFIDMDTPSDAASLLLAVRRARNNLFHGSKVNLRDRDKKLVSAGTVILKHALEVSQLDEKTRKVSSAYAFASLGEP